MEYGNLQEEIIRKKGKRRKNPLSLALFFLCLVLLAGCIGAFWFLNDDRIEKAREFALSRQFYEAKALSSLLLPTNPEAQELKSYINAGLLLESGEYNNAGEAFTAMGDYLDATGMKKECTFRYGQQLFAEENYEEASRVFGSLDGYGESKTWADESTYLVGLSHYEKLRDAKDPVDICKAAGDAIGMFSSIPDHENGVKMNERTSDYIYALGQAAFEIASMTFNDTSLYDMEAVTAENQEATGENTLNEALPPQEESLSYLFEEAFMYFVLIPDYKESAQYLDIINVIPQPQAIAAKTLRDNNFDFAPARRFIFGRYIAEFFYGFWVGGGYGIEFTPEYRYYLLSPEDGTGESFGSGGISTLSKNAWKTSYSFRILSRDSIEVIGKKTYELRRDIINQPSEDNLSLEPGEG